jgi:hypothetical protein
MNDRRRSRLQGWAIEIRCVSSQALVVVPEVREKLLDAWESTAA